MACLLLLLMQEFSSIPKSLITMVSWLAGDPNLTLTYSHASHPVAAGLLAVMYVFVLGLVLMSLLTSLMTNSLKKVGPRGGALVTQGQTAC